MGTAKAATPANDQAKQTQPISPVSKEIVVGLVGYAGAGCSTAAKRLRVMLEAVGYDVEPIKLSSLIESFSGTKAVVDASGKAEGRQKLGRAKLLQDLGDRIRKDHGHHAIAALAVREIRKRRGVRQVGEKRVAFVLDSLKHAEEVELLRSVYEHSFRLMAVHCERPKRLGRLMGSAKAGAKFSETPEDEILAFVARDEKDSGKKYGQQVRDAFHQGDFFVDNSADSRDGENLNDALDRFVNLLINNGLVRPTLGERAIYHAHAAAMQSSCLSRQVGAALVSKDGTIVSTGTNDVPRFGGGVYDESSEPDHRCFAWEWDFEKQKFKGCHNKRKRDQLHADIASWLASNLSEDLARVAHPVPTSGADVAEKARADARDRILNFFESQSEKLNDLPGVRDVIEYSRSIHAEMNALLTAARNAISPAGATLYCTVFPCHNCARHLVTAGVQRVYYIEPFVKSLAAELHYDSIATELSEGTQEGGRLRMEVLPFTGVGPRMYSHFFAKRGELKRADGSYDPPTGDVPTLAVRLRELTGVEERAARLIPEKADA